MVRQVGGVGSLGGLMRLWVAVWGHVGLCVVGECGWVEEGWGVGWLGGSTVTGGGVQGGLGEACGVRCVEG